MQKFLSVWGTLDTKKQVTAGLAIFAMIVTFLAIYQMSGSKKQVLLYSNLESAAAGEVVAKLEQAGVTYEVRGQAIYVDPSIRDSLRMTLASEGLPSIAGAGYELLDTLSGFGTTSQMFDAAYWRAKEGELARTIVTNPQIKNARVHISNSSSKPFSQEFTMKASVTVTTGVTALSATKIAALKYLIASAVAGLDISDVAIIDTQRGLLSASEDLYSASNLNTELILGLRKSVERILEARVGYGNAIVEVSVETVTESESVFERSFDPDTRVIISTDTEERSTQSDDTRGVGGVSVASNLPEGDASSDAKSSSQNTETRERVNYEVSETKREIIKTPGAIKRLSVAVLVNGTMATQDDGSILYEPRSEIEIDELRDLVAAAVGFREDRGDLLTVKTMEFGQISQLGATAQSNASASMPLDLMTLIQLAVLALVIIILGVFVVRPILVGRSQVARAELPSPLGNSPDVSIVSELQNLSDPSSLPALTGEIDTGNFQSSSLVLPDLNTNLSDPLLSENLGNLETEFVSPVERLKQLIEDRQDEAVDVLRGWMEEKEGNL